jgi:lipopolysaccharide/colanic/teichoic acid biosynthesis glycosyltransferase
MDDLVTKRIFDLAAGTLALALAFPFLLVCAFLVWLDSGRPVFFAHARLGLNGSLFPMLKFRSMCRNADDFRNPDGSTYNGPNDPRVTPVGRWLRKSSLDELPQLINVVRGEMSLIGPRPDVPDAVSHYRMDDFQRLSVKPGITGWAQVHGRNGLAWERRRDLDLEYVQKRDFWMDIRIILHTIPVVLLGRGIYVEKPEQEQKGAPSCLARRK